jgi:hypothetical protein
MPDSGGASSLYLPTLSSSNFNYKSKSNYVVWANAGQRNLLTLNNTVDVSQCDVFALSISSFSPVAVIATSYAPQSTLFYSLSAVSAANASNGTFVGPHSPPQTNGPMVST